MSDEKLVTYHLPLTYLTVTGATMTQTDLSTGVRDRQESAEIVLGVQADPDDYYRLDLEGSGLIESKFALEMTDDRRLATASGTSTGQAGTVLNGIAKVVGGLAGGAAQLTGPLGSLVTALTRRDLQERGETGKRQDDPPSVPPVYERQARLQEVRQVATELSASVIKISQQVVDGEKTVKELAAARAALDTVRDELSILERHYTAWQTLTTDEEVTSHTFRMTMSQVLPLSAVLSKKRDDVMLLSEDGPTEESDQEEWKKFAPLRAMLDGIDMIVSHDTAIEKGPSSEPSRGHIIKKIVFRRPHYTDLVLLKLTKTGFEEVSRTTVLVMSDESYTSELPFDKSVWSKKHLAVEFSELGTVTGITTGESSSMADAVSALAQLPSELGTGIQTASGLGAQVEAVRNQRITRALARIGLEKQLLIARAVEHPDAAGDAIAAELAELESTKKRLTLLKEIGELQAPAPIPDA